MRSILILTSTYPRWQGDKEPAFVHLLARQLATHYQVLVLAPHFPGAKSREMMDGVDVHRFRYCFPFAEHLAYEGGIMTNLRGSLLKWLLVPPFLVSQMLKAVILCRKFNVRLVHAHWLIPQGLIALMIRHACPGKPAVLSTSHGADLFALRGGLLQRLKHYVVQHSDQVTVVSTAMRNRLAETGADSPHINVLSMGVDLQNQFTPGNTHMSPTELVCVGRLVEKKGIPVLLEAVSILVPEFPGLHLRIVGDGPDRDTLEQLADQLKLTQNVEFTGGVPNSATPDYYRASSIAVVPSVIASSGDQEGLGLVAVEALGCGCATIVSDLPALRDVIRHDENGLVFKAGDADDLADQIRHLLSDQDLLSRLSRQGRPSVLDRFDWQTVGSAYRTLIGDAMAETSSG